MVKRTLWTLCELTYIEHRPQQSALNATHMKARWEVFTPLRAALRRRVVLPFLSAPLPAALGAAGLQLAWKAHRNADRNVPRLTLCLRFALFFGAIVR